MSIKIQLHFFLILLVLLASVRQAAAQGTAFSYQGRLNVGTSQASGSYDLLFSLFNTGNGGVAVAGPLTNSAVAVSNGLFLVTLDFGGVFGGTNYWLEIGVRTNGSGAFTTLNPRQAVTPAPVALFAEAAGTVSGVVPGGGLSGTYSSAVAFSNSSNSFNGSYAGNGGGLLNVNAATLGGLTPSNLLAMAATSLASSFTSGSMDTNTYLTSQSISGWQSRTERLPWRGSGFVNQSDLTNQIAYQNTIRNLGFNVMGTFQQAYLPARVGGHLAFNTNNFPAGLQGFENIIHTNGFRFLLWYDQNNAAPNDAKISTAQYVDDIQTIVSWHPDILWIDEEGYYALLASQILATNTFPIQVMYGITDVAGSIVDARSISLGNAWRLHVSADINSWNSFVEAANQVEANAWYYSGPGQFFYLGPEANGFGTATEVASGVALQAMWGNMFLMPFVHNTVNSAGPFTSLTNQNILAIQGDAADVCARRLLVTNGCWVYLKPLQTPNGPNFAVMVLNINPYATNLTFNLSALNNGQQSSGYLTAPSYSVYSLKADSAIGSFQTNIVVNGLASHDYALFSLAPMTQTALTGNGAWSDILNPSPGVVLGTPWTNTYGSPVTLTIDGRLNLAAGESSVVTLTNLTTTESHVMAGSTLSTAGSSYFSYPYEISPNGVIQVIASNTGTATATISKATVRIKFQ